MLEPRHVSLSAVPSNNLKHYYIFFYRFLWAIYASQGFQAIFFFVFVGLIGSSIRYLIKERETRNTAVSTP